MGAPWVYFNGKDCSGCKHLNDRGYCEFTACIIPCTVRATIPEAKPQTNADRIRAMSDEELATVLNRHCSCSSLRTWHEGMCDKPCRECWLDWLRQEAQDG